MTDPTPDNVVEWAQERLDAAKEAVDELEESYEQYRSWKREWNDDYRATESRAVAGGWD